MAPWTSPRPLSHRLISRVWVSHVIRMNESYHIYEWVISHMAPWVCPRPVSQRLSHISEAWHGAYVIAHLSMSRVIRVTHVTCVNESCHTNSHVTRVDESCRTCRWVMSHEWMSHDTWRKGMAVMVRCDFGKWVMSHTHKLVWMSHGTSQGCRKTCHTWHICMPHGTFMNECHDSFIRVPWRIHMCAMTHWPLWHACHEGVEHIHESVMAHTWMSHVIHVWMSQLLGFMALKDMTRSYVCRMNESLTHSAPYARLERHDSFICASGLIHICDMTHSWRAREARCVRARARECSTCAPERLVIHIYIYTHQMCMKRHGVFEDGGNATDPWERAATRLVNHFCSMNELWIISAQWMDSELFLLNEWSLLNE